MDGFDLRLLDALQANGRLTSQELAERVGLSASQCARRRMALEDQGVIQSYHARLSPGALNLELIVFVEISLASHSGDSAKRLLLLLETMPEVQEAYSMTGETDYLVKIVARDLKALSQILNERLLTHDGVAKVRSSIALDRLKQTQSLPLNHL